MAEISISHFNMAAPQDTAYNCEVNGIRYSIQMHFDNQFDAPPQCNLIAFNIATTLDGSFNAEGQKETALQSKYDMLAAAVTKKCQDMQLDDGSLWPAGQGNTPRYQNYAPYLNGSAYYASSDIHTMTNEHYSTLSMEVRKAGSARAIQSMNALAGIFPPELVMLARERLMQQTQVMSPAMAAILDPDARTNLGDGSIHERTRSGSRGGGRNMF